MEIAKVMNNKLLIKKRGNQMRRKVVAGNWKMNMLPNEAMSFIRQIESEVNNSKAEVILCVPYTDLFYSLLTAQDTKIKIGAQNMHWEEKGAYTGEISGQMLKCIGVEYVIIGHSERRQYFAETDETVNKKVKAALLNGLKPIVCVGETLEQREQGKQKEILPNQTHLELEGLNEEQLKSVMIAYEPIWAIGTGIIPEQQQLNSLFLWLSDFTHTQLPDYDIQLLYGGSVNKNSINELKKIVPINGFLIGTASTQFEKFKDIIL